MVNEALPAFFFFFYFGDRGLERKRAGVPGQVDCPCKWPGWPARACLSERRNCARLQRLVVRVWRIWLTSFVCLEKQTIVNFVGFCGSMGGRGPLSPHFCFFFFFHQTIVRRVGSGLEGPFPPPPFYYFFLFPPHKRVASRLWPLLTAGDGERTLSEWHHEAFGYHAWRFRLGENSA